MLYINAVCLCMHENHISVKKCYFKFCEWFTTCMSMAHVSWQIFFPIFILIISSSFSVFLFCLYNYIFVCRRFNSIFYRSMRKFQTIHLHNWCYILHSLNFENGYLSALSTLCYKNEKKKNIYIIKAKMKINFVIALNDFLCKTSLEFNNRK